MDAMTIWFIAGAILLAAFVVVGLVAVNRRSIRRGRPHAASCPADPADRTAVGRRRRIRIVGRSSSSVPAPLRPPAEQAA